MPQQLAEVIELFPQHPVRSRDEGVEFVSHPDGTEIVEFGDGVESELEAVEIESEGFTANLAANLSQSQRHAIAQRLIEYHRVDLESRKDWESLTKTALRLLGVEKFDPSSLPFPGAAAVQHPLIAEACVQFQANAIEEFFPATGPVKGDIAGKATAETQAQTERATEFMNFYLTVEDPSYYADSDQMLFYLPIAGSVFRKVWIDPRNGLPRARYVKSDDFVAPYFARDLENCPRYCHQYTMTGAEIRRAMAQGEYLPLDLPPPPLDANEDGKTNVDDVADRRQRVLHEDDELYDILEYHVEMALPEGVDELDEGTIDLPYIVTVDKTSEEILAIRRNWRDIDEQRKKRVWFAHYKFLPGLGFYGWGFLHVIGSLAEATSGSVRALLDSALMATIQGGFRAKDGAKTGGSVAIEPGKWKDIDATAEELSKTFYTPPFREPSPALFQLFQALVQDGRRFASLTEVLVGQADNKAPVGTTIALIEQSMKLFTAIHKRIFAAAREEFRMLAELLYEFSPYTEYPYHLDGEEKFAFRDDFDDRVDFIPVADPNIISDVQRIALAQAVLEAHKADPQLYGIEERVEAHRRYLKALKIPDWEAIAPKMPKATYLDPIGENALVMVGKMIRAFPGQRHDLHIAAHQHQVQSAQNTLPADQFQQVYLQLMSHIREHQALWMMEQVSAQMGQTVGAPLPPVDIYSQAQDLPPELEMAVTLAAVQNLPPIPPPQPGSAGAEQQAQAEADARNKAKEAETLAKIERDTAAFAAKQKQAEEEHAQRLRHAEEEHDLRMRHMDEQTAAQILRQSADAANKRRQNQLAGNTKLAMDMRRERARAEAEKERSTAPTGKKSASKAKSKRGGK